MRFLLLGEFSGFFLNLKKGLERMGHQVVLYADGDGFKNIPGADDRLYKPSKSFITKVFRLTIGPFFDKRLSQDYDAVLIINLGLFEPFVVRHILKKMRKHNKKLFLSSCGYDYALLKAFRSGKFEYYMFDENLNSLPRYSHLRWRLYDHFANEEKNIKRYINIVIPTAYDYTLGYNDSSISKVIPLPLDCDSIDYSENSVSDKIIIFHGINRELEKGTKYIREAMLRLKERYPDLVEIVFEGNMPYKDYLQLLRKVNIVVDQCKGFFYGMNACIAMAMGKVVLCGINEESMNAIGTTKDECPVVPIKRDADVIFQRLESIVTNPTIIEELGRKGRQYVEKYHDSIKVALQYEKIFKEY